MDEKEAMNLILYLCQKEPSNKYYSILKKQKYIGQLRQIYYLKQGKERTLLGKKFEELTCLNVREGDTGISFCYILCYEKLKDIEDENLKFSQLSPLDKSYLEKLISVEFVKKREKAKKSK